MPRRMHIQSRNVAAYLAERNQNLYQISKERVSRELLRLFRDFNDYVGDSPVGVRRLTLTGSHDPRCAFGNKE